MAFSGFLFVTLICVGHIVCGFPIAGIATKSVWDMLRDVWYSEQDTTKPETPTYETKKSLYSSAQIKACGDFFCKWNQRCSYNTTECHSMVLRYGPPCCIGKNTAIRKMSTDGSVSTDIVRGLRDDFVPSELRGPAPIVMGEGGYGVPVHKKTINERCVEQIKQSAGPSFNYEKMHATLRIIGKLAEAKFRSDILNRKKDINYNEPVFDVDYVGLKEDMDTVSPCSGFLYQSDILLQENQLDLIIENAVVYVGDVLRDIDFDDVFAEDEKVILNKSPALRIVKQPAAPCPPYNPCNLKEAGPPAPPPEAFFKTTDEREILPVRTFGEFTDAVRSHRSKRKIQSDKGGRWKMPIRYRIDKALNSALVEAGIKRWKDATCLEFEKTTLAVRKLRGNFLNFVKGDGCHSMVGRNQDGEGQSVSLGAGCEAIGTVSHEVGHALGLWHEHARPDRDESVAIRGDSIPDKYLGQFLVQDFKTKGIPYDYGSIMHYSAKSYVKSPKLFSIEKSAYKNTMGQRDILSFLDCKVVNQVYCSDVCKKKLKCANGGYADPKACSKCRCPEGLGGKCDEPAKSDGSCGKTTLKATGKWQTIKQSGKKTCNYLIQASGNIKIEVTKLQFKCAKVCESFVEVKFLKLMGPTGARNCCSRGKVEFETKGNQAVIIYKGEGGHSMELKFKA